MTPTDHLGTGTHSISCLGTFDPRRDRLEPCFGKLAPGLGRVAPGLGILESPAHLA